MATEEYRRLELLGEFRSAEEERRFRELKAQAAAGAAAAPSPTPAGGARRVSVEADKESFRRGGLQFIPPRGPAVLPAVWEDVVVPNTAPDQLWFIFRSVDGADDPFRGALVCGSLTKPGQESGAWKMKQVLEALGVEYKETERGVDFGVAPGTPCQVDWQSVTFKGKTELRIQDVYPAKARIGQL